MRSGYSGLLKLFRFSTQLYAVFEQASAENPRCYHPPVPLPDPPGPHPESNVPVNVHGHRDRAGAEEYGKTIKSDQGSGRISAFQKRRARGDPVSQCCIRWGETDLKHFSIGDIIHRT